MENGAPDKIFCIYCGSPDVQKISMTKKEGDNPKTLSAQIVGSGGSYSGSHSSSNTVSLGTYYCMRCKMTEANGTMEPGKVLMNDNNGYSLGVILPESLLRYFGSIKLQHGDIIKAVESIDRRLKQIVKKFEKTGTDPCKDGKIGLRAKMAVGNAKVDVYVLVENNGTGRYARIVYGGKWSYCK